MRFLAVLFVTTAGIAIVLAAPAKAQAPGHTDAQYVRGALEGNDAEMLAAQLALEKSDSDDVRLLAQFLIHDGSVMKDQMLPLAGEMNVRMEQGKTSADEAQAMERLRALSGAAFDRQFIKAMVEANQAAVTDARMEVAQAQTPAVKNNARTLVPILEQHLEMAQNVAGAHHVPIAGGQ